MRLLNDLLNMHDGFDDEGWLKECKKHMVDTFPREDPFTILAPAGFDIDKVCCIYAVSSLCALYVCDYEIDLLEGTHVQYQNIFKDPTW